MPNKINEMKSKKENGMITIKVLGPGCNNCKMVEANTRAALENLGVQANVEKVTAYPEIKKWNILSTPGLVINDKVVCAGRIPDVDEITTWLATELEKLG
jgi:small redox-active disulfide protein 2